MRELGSRNLSGKFIITRERITVWADTKPLHITHCSDLLTHTKAVPRKNWIKTDRDKKKEKKEFETDR